MQNLKTLNLHRPGALAEFNPYNGVLRLAAAAVVEFLAPGRIPSLGVRGDLPLKPGVIYKAFTGVSPASEFPFLTYLVRPSQDCWKYGLEVKRLDFGEHSELIIYFTVLEPLRTDQTQLIFEAMQPSTTANPFTHVETQDGVPLALPGIKQALEPVTKVRFSPPLAPNAQSAAPVNGRQMSDAESIKKAADWLNSPDERGKVVSGSDISAIARSVEKPAQVTESTFPKEPRNPLSKGVVVTKATAAGADGSEQMKVSDLKEEFTVIEPQRETFVPTMTDEAQPVDPLAGV